MDLRVQKTKHSIINAFLTLRAHRPLEKISVKELSELAMINKATFYLHYKDIYDLAETLEQEVVGNVIRNIPHPETMLTDTASFFRELLEAYFTQRTMIHTLFSGQRMDQLPSRIEAELRKMAYAQYPELEQDTVFSIQLTYSVYGGYYAYRQHMDDDLVEVSDLLAQISGVVGEVCRGFEGLRG